VRDVARQADVCASQIYRWRRECRGDRPGFTEMVVVGTGPVDQRSDVSAVEIAFADRVQVRIPATTSPDLAAAIVKALSGR
jgi:transposase-like protein